MTTVNSVLIVDDEPAVRNIMARWVTALGLESETAGSAEEALATLRNQQYDAAVIDVLMPGHDGLWLADRLQRDHPHMAVVIATAQPNILDRDSRHRALTERPIADFLLKPFKRERFA